MVAGSSPAAPTTSKLFILGHAVVGLVRLKWLRNVALQCPRFCKMDYAAFILEFLARPPIRLQKTPNSLAHGTKKQMKQIWPEIHRFKKAIRSAISRPVKVGQRTPRFSISASIFGPCCQRAEAICGAENWPCFSFRLGAPEPV